MTCYLFDCGNPSVCLFSTNMGFTSVQLSARNLHTTESKPANHNKHGTKLRSTVAQFLSTTTKSQPATTFAIVDNHYAHNKTGESFRMLQINGTCVAVVLEAV